MNNRTRRVIGWISKDAMTPADAADAAIAKAREVCGTAAGVLHMDTVTGRLTLLADVDAPIPPGTFVRGVRFDSDPDVLAADLRSEALAARLIPGKQPRTKKALLAKRPGPKPGTRHALTPDEEKARKEAVALLIRGEHAVDDICASYGITRSTLYRWRNALADAEAA
jgi:hypothetical protein